MKTNVEINLNTMISIVTLIIISITGYWVKSIDVRIDKLDSRINTVERDVSDLKGDIGYLKGSVERGNKS